jgi:hypothetical protein
MADLTSGVSGAGKPKTGATVAEGAKTEGSKEEAMGEHDGVKAFTTGGGEPDGQVTQGKTARSCSWIRIILSI